MTDVPCGLGSSGVFLFAGGTDPATDIVDLYSVESSQWSNSTLGAARNGLAAAASSNVAWFGGGVAVGVGDRQHSGAAEVLYSNRVDIYTID